MTGTIKNVVVDRGFGFISPPNEPDIFFHCKDLRGLEFGEQLVGQRVEFVLTSTPKGNQAREVCAAK